MAAKGSRPVEIAHHLNGKGVPSRSVYRRSRHPHLGAERRSDRSEWTSGAVTKLLGNIVYLGHIAQGKTTKVSFKSRTTIRNPRRDWIVVMNTHEPLIDQDTFDMARRRTQCRTCKKKGTFFNLFSGIARCADCGRNMSTVSTRKKGSPANLACGGYKLRGGRECSNHFIDYNHLYRIVLDTVREHTDEHGLSQDLLFRLIDRIEIGQGSYVRTAQGRVKRQTIRIHVRFSVQDSIKECLI
jgi:hypothetical protein